MLTWHQVLVLNSSAESAGSEDQHIDDNFQGQFIVEFNMKLHRMALNNGINDSIAL